MIITPLFFELAILALMGVSGISVGLLAGFRHPLLLIPFALLLSVSV